MELGQQKWAINEADENEQGIFNLLIVHFLLSFFS